MYCGNCGKVINDNAVVCIYCGCATQKYRQQNAYNQQQYQQNYQNPYQQQYQQNYQNPYQQQYQQNYQNPYQQQYQQNYQNPYQQQYQQNYQNPYQQQYQQPYQTGYQNVYKSSPASIILGIVGIVTAWLFALVGHITSIIGIVLGVKEYKTTGNMAGLILSILGEVCSVISSLIGIVSVLNMM